MKSKGRLKTILTIILAVIMFISPVFVAGCFDFSNGSGNGGQNQGGGSGTGSGGGTSGGGSGGGTGGGGTSGGQHQETKPSLTFNEYNQYFKNYRITYNPGLFDRDDFNTEIKNQNKAISTKILNSLYAEYGDNEVTTLFNQDVSLSFKSIEQNKDVYLAYNGAISKTTSTDRQYFSHNNSINPQDGTPWASQIKSDNSSGQIQDKLQLAEALILAGNNVVDAGQNISSDFDTLYKQYLNADGSVKQAEVNSIYAGINHLGFTDTEILQVEYFVLNYIIGKSLVAQDNTKFANVYFDFNDQTIKKTADTRFDKFLTYETFAVGYLNQDSTISVGVSGKTLDAGTMGVLNYAVEYLKSATCNGEGYKQSFGANRLLGDINLSNITATNIQTLTQVDNPDGDSDQTKAISTILDTLIKNKKIKDGEREEYPFYRDKDFDANVWKYDTSGNTNSSNAGEVVKDSNGHTLFSVKFAGFKNYTNTVHQIVNATIGAQASNQTRQDWESKHGSQYPYDKEYPNVPASYFADYDNADMLFDGQNGVAHMFSGYQNYQNMVLMPQKSVQLESGALFITRDLASGEVQDASGMADGSGDFDISIYLRYYDADSQSFATWDAVGGTSQFYPLGTKTITYQSYKSDDNIKNIVPITLDFSIKDILASATTTTGGASCVLNPFADTTKISLHKSTLITKQNYGYLYGFVNTPDGNKVVCYNGKAENSPSYLEIVFSSNASSKFQFCFYPTVAYKVN